MCGLSYGGTYLVDTYSKCLVIVTVDVGCSEVVLGSTADFVDFLVLSIVTSVSRRNVFDRLMNSVVLLMYDVLESNSRRPGPDRVFENVTGYDVVTVDVTTTISHTSW